jgi:hypothetical protein
VREQVMRESMERERDAERARREHVTHLMSWEIKKRVGNFSKVLHFFSFGGSEERALDTSNVTLSWEINKRVGKFSKVSALVYLLCSTTV